MAAIDDAIREFGAKAKQQDAALASGAAQPAAAVVSRWMTIPIDTPVLDLVTGQQGVVIGGKRENVIIPPASQSGD